MVFSKKKKKAKYGYNSNMKLKGIPNYLSIFWAGYTFNFFNRNLAIINTFFPPLIPGDWKTPKSLDFRTFWRNFTN
jgi:hypothetical protein